MSQGTLTDVSLDPILERLEQDISQAKKYWREYEITQTAK